MKIHLREEEEEEGVGRAARLARAYLLIVFDELKRSFMFVGVGMIDTVVRRCGEFFFGRYHSYHVEVFSGQWSCFERMGKTRKG